MAAVSRTANTSELIRDGASSAPADEAGVISCLAFLRLRAKIRGIPAEHSSSLPISERFVLFWFCFNFGEHKHIKYFIVGPWKSCSVLAKYCFHLAGNWIRLQKAKTPRLPTNSSVFSFPSNLKLFSSIHLALASCYSTRSPADNFASSQDTFLQCIWKFLKLVMGKAALSRRRWAKVEGPHQSHSVEVGFGLHVTTQECFPVPEWNLVN